MKRHIAVLAVVSTRFVRRVSVKNARWEIFSLRSHVVYVRYESLEPCLQDVYHCAAEMISEWDISGIPDITSVFKNCQLPPSPDISRMNVPGITDMSGMLSSCQLPTPLPFTTPPSATEMNIVERAARFLLVDKLTANGLQALGSTYRSICVYKLGGSGNDGWVGDITIRDDRAYCIKNNDGQPLKLTVDCMDPELADKVVALMLGNWENCGDKQSV